MIRTDRIDWPAESTDQSPLAGPPTLCLRSLNYKHLASNRPDAYRGFELMHRSSNSVLELKVGDTATCERKILPADIDHFATVSGDDNPLHTDPLFAATLGFRDRVAHGMLALSMISRLVGTELPGPGSLWITENLEFVEPVFPYDTLRATVTVTSISTAAQLVQLDTQVYNESTQALILRGTAKVRIPQVVDVS